MGQEHAMRVLILLAALLIGLSTPACAADDIATAQNVIRSQEQAFSRDDPAAAYSHAAPAIKGIFPDAETFMAMVRNSDAPVYRHKSFEFGEARVADGKIAQRVHILDTEGGSMGSAVYAGAAAGRQREDHRLRVVEGWPGGIAFSSEGDTGSR
jgi:hypothetical protein